VRQIGVNERAAERGLGLSDRRLKCPTVADPGTTTEPLKLDLVQLQDVLDRQKVRFKAHFASF
jgi:hypothetical protein